MVDMAHIAGLVATGLHQSPIPYADVVTSTTHKTLRGPRGGIILTNNIELIKKINKAVFPGIQGGPLENIIAAKAVCFGEALKPEFKKYMQDVVENAKFLAAVLQNNRIKVLTDGTDTHLILINLKGRGITGQELQNRLEKIGITANKNAIPFDTENKKNTSGLRLGTAAITSRGLDKQDIIIIGEMIAKCIELSEEDYNDLQDSMKI
jgi:glycine hydroxymethyltransferase